MKWLRFVTNPAPSKLLKGLAVIAALKLALLLVVMIGGLDFFKARDACSPMQMTVALAQEETAAPAQSQAQPQTPAAQGSVADQWEQVRKKQEALNRREQELRALEQEVNAKLEELHTLQAKLQDMLDEAKQVQDEKLKHLVDVYSNMKAKQAAQVLESLDEEIAVRILAGMRGRTAGEILSYVEAKKAARLSEKLTKMQLPFE